MSGPFLELGAVVGAQSNYDGDAVYEFVSATEDAGHSLTYTPNTYGNGTDYDGFQFQVQNNGGTANGGVDTDPTPRTMTINVTWVNQGPTGADNTVTTLENQPYVFATADFGYSDPLDGMSFLAVEISSLPSGGALTENGNPVAIGQYFPITDIASNLLVYTPNTYGNGTAYDSFQFQVQNNGGTANGGVDTDPTPRTMTINVTWVNQAPSFTASDPEAVDATADPCGEPVSVANWAAFDPGAPNQYWETATYTVTSFTSPSLFSTPPAVDASGNLTYTVAPYVNGTSTFCVQVQNSGGCADCGQNTGPVLSFTITVQNVMESYPVTVANGTGDGTLNAAIVQGNMQNSLLLVTFSLPAGTNTVNLATALPTLLGAAHN